MEALWREALHLVNDGIATTDEIDQAVAYGPGLRWAFMGTFLTYRLAGGEAGMRHFLAQFGPSLEWPWCHMTAPELTPELIHRIASQSDAQAGGVPVRELERLRDDCLIAVLQALRGQKYAAGAVLDAYDQKLFGTSHARRMAPGDDHAQPLRLHTSRVLPEWVDYNGHLTESRYLQVFGDSTDAVLRYVGSDAAYNQAGFSYYTVETHLQHLREVEAGVPLRVMTWVLGADDKRMHLFHVMTRDDDGTELATAEHMMLHVDTKAGRACAAQGDVLTNVRRLADAHAALPRPQAAGRAIRSPGT
jgi:carnitine 3-dehydrogenase